MVWAKAKIWKAEIENPRLIGLHHPIFTGLVFLSAFPIADAP
jgi:hypothetical protein